MAFCDLQHRHAALHQESVSARSGVPRRGCASALQPVCAHTARQRAAGSWSMPSNARVEQPVHALGIRRVSAKRVSGFCPGAALEAGLGRFLFSR